MTEKLEEIVRTFVLKHDITSPDVIGQKDSVIVDAFDLIEQLVDVVGYAESEEQKNALKMYINSTRYSTDIVFARNADEAVETMIRKFSEKYTEVLFNRGDLNLTEYRISDDTWVEIEHD